MPGYIPSTDAGLLAWATNYSGLITATPTAYGLTAPQATVLDGLFNDYAAAYALAVAPSTRTVPTVADKDNAKFALIAEARALAAIVQAWPSITALLLADLGLTVRDTTPTPIPAPVTVPLVTIVAGSNLAQTIRYADELTPAARKKPFGAVAIELWGLVNDTPPAGPEACAFMGLHTKNPVQMSYGAGDAGKLATIYGRWVTRRGLVGPWSLAASMTVPSGT